MTESLSDVYAYIAIVGFFLIFLYYLIELAHENVKKDIALQKNDDFMKVNGYSYDLVLVFHVYAEDDKNFSPFQIQFSLRNVINLLNEAQLETSFFYSCQMDEIYVKIRATPERLKSEASRIRYRLLLDKKRLRAKTQSGHKVLGKWQW